MSAAADKARWYLEQSVPELKSDSRKKIFTAAEITSIATQRSNFEHKINARGSSPADYAAYAEFEINLDALRRKRVKRLGIRSAQTHSGQRRVFFVFDRGVRKFPGDVGLWMQGVEYARSQRALKKVSQMLTDALRLHPAKSELWTYAARFAVDENGDMTEARGYMQRGLRFCKNVKTLWVQNFRLEVSWIAKIHARRRILGIEGEEWKEEKVKIVGEDDDNMLMLPKVTAEDFEPEGEQDDKLDVTALAKLDSSPVITGAIPMAVFDAAMAQFDNDPDLALRFYNDLTTFESFPALLTIAQHIHDKIQTIDSKCWQACAVSINQSTLGVSFEGPEFPSCIRQALQRVSSGLATTRQRQDLLAWCKQYLAGMLEKDLDPAIEQVLQSKLQTLS